jgi:hypothetical protein
MKLKNYNLQIFLKKTTGSMVPGDKNSTQTTNSTFSSLVDAFWSKVGILQYVC